MPEGVIEEAGFEPCRFAWRVYQERGSGRKVVIVADGDDTKRSVHSVPDIAERVDPDGGAAVLLANRSPRGGYDEIDRDGIGVRHWTDEEVERRLEPDP